MAKKEQFDELFEEMLDLAQVPLEEQEEEEKKPAEEPEAPEPEKPEAPEEEEEPEEEGELSDEWKIKIGNFGLTMRWINQDRRLGIKYRGPTKYMDVPKKLVAQESYRKPFKQFLRKVLDFMSTGQGD